MGTTWGTTWAANTWGANTWADAQSPVVVIYHVYNVAAADESVRSYAAEDGSVRSYAGSAED